MRPIWPFTLLLLAACSQATEVATGHESAVIEKAEADVAAAEAAAAEGR